LVTGANGFVGSHVVRQLLASDLKVAALVRPGSSLARLEGLERRLEIIRLALGDASEIKNQLNNLRPDACIHLAWYAEPRKYLDARDNLDSLRDSLDLLEALGRSGCQHLVGVGTCFEYEMRPTLLTEDSATKPHTLYAAAKLAFSLVAAQRLAQLGIGMAWARLFYIYGPYEDERRLVPAAIKALGTGLPFPTTSGEQVRDYLHVEDVAAGLSTLSRKRLRGTFNVCSGEAVTVAALLQQVGDLSGRPDLIQFGALAKREGDPDFICGDNQRLRQQGLWSPRYSLQEGLANTVAWWLNRPQ
jgi:nucleoside-diphosphate-sugar epimerase